MLAHPLRDSIRVTLFLAPLNRSAVFADGADMSSPDLRRINRIEVPLVVVLGERQLKLRDILTWVPGSIIELAKDADEELDIRINNKAIGSGTAVKVGENFGVQVSYCGDPKQRIEALGDGSTPGSSDEVDAEAMAAALLDGQF